MKYILFVDHARQQAWIEESYDDEPAVYGGLAGQVMRDLVAAETALGQWAARGYRVPSVAV